MQSEKEGAFIKMKKIRNKIVVAVLGAIVITALVLSIMSVTTTLNSSIVTTKSTLEETAVIAANSASTTIATYTVAVGEIATNEILYSSDASTSEKRAYIDSKTAQYYMRFGSMLDENGIDIFTGEDLSNRSYYNGAKAGGTYFSEPYINDDKSDAYIAVAAPVMDGEKFVGVLYFYCDTVVLQNFVESVAIGESGSAYILDKTGNTIAYNDYSLVLSQSNAIADAKNNPTDSLLAELAAIEQQMISGNTGVGTYNYNGLNQYQAYAPIPNTDGWSIAVSSTEAELLATANNSIILIFIVSSIMIAIGIVIAIYLSSSISKPVVQCVERLNSLAQGDLTSPVPVVNTKDETHQLAQSTGAIISSLSEIIFDLDTALADMADGTLNIDFNKEDAYIGDYRSIYTSVVLIADSLSTTMAQINTATSQLNSGADQMSSGAQVLAQGATEQSTAIEGLATTIEHMASQTAQTATDAQDVRAANEKSQQALAHSNEQMLQMLSAMQEINDKATEISKIVKAIDDIAFQTNILALNAAVEAARAGASGKGFAVVADEVRNLAAKSAESAKNTTLLIEETIAVVRNGNQIANETSNSIGVVGTNATELGELVNRITAAVSAQAAASNQINHGVEQISSVVQSNTATAEESAATSQELSNQARALETLVSRFRF